MIRVLLGVELGGLGSLYFGHLRAGKKGKRDEGRYREMLGERTE